MNFLAINRTYEESTRLQEEEGNINLRDRMGRPGEKPLSSFGRGLGLYQEHFVEMILNYQKKFDFFFNRICFKVKESQESF